ncbi:hypothetical protein SCAR479_04701 [Seiridium cardinale]|uniref:Uncharacterized protein n=1 Tax=Seiridium cardinale TaxID=138064 RepID=A0ABR2XXC3_9PEZI
MPFCTKDDLVKETQRIARWTHSRYAEYKPHHVQKYDIDYELSSKAKKNIQSWIHTDTAWCQFRGIDNDFWKVSLAVFERLAAVEPKRRVAFFCRNYPFVKGSTNIKDRETGKDVGALALLYSMIDQMVTALSDEEGAQFEASLLTHLKHIDGTKNTYQDALDGISHLLVLIGDGLVVLIDHIDALYQDDDDDMSNTMLSRLMGMLGGNQHRMRLWVSYYQPGQSIYRDHGFSVGNLFSVKPKLLRRKHALKSLDFGSSELENGRKLDADKDVAAQSPASVSSNDTFYESPEHL